MADADNLPLGRVRARGEQGLSHPRRRRGDGAGRFRLRHLLRDGLLHFPHYSSSLFGRHERGVGGEGRSPWRRSLRRRKAERAGRRFEDFSDLRRITAIVPLNRGL